MALHGTILGCGRDELNALAAQLDSSADRMLAGDMKAGRGDAVRASKCAAVDICRACDTGNTAGVHQELGCLPPHGVEGPEPVPYDARDAFGGQEPADSLREAGEHQQRRATASEQRRRAGLRAASRARCKRPIRADRTFGATRWPTAGPRSARRVRQSRSSTGDRGRSPRGHGPMPEKRERRAIGIGARKGREHGHWPGNYAPRSKRTMNGC